MRRLGILLALVFAASLISALPMGAAQCPTPVKHHKMMKKSVHKAKMHKVKMRCYPVRQRKAAKSGAGPKMPTVTCPSPIVNVPSQPAPIVNVPQQPAPVVNVAAPPPSTAVTVDSSSIYIIRDNQLMILDKNGLCLKQKVSLDQLPLATPTTATSNSSSMNQ